MSGLALKRLTGFQWVQVSSEGGTLKMERTPRNTQNRKALERVNHADWRRKSLAARLKLRNERTVDLLLIYEQMN